MKILQYILLVTVLITGRQALGQRIVYSEPDRDDSRRMNFDIIGKIGGNFLIYKNIRNSNYICIYNNDMQQVSRIEHSYMPNDRLINVERGGVGHDVTPAGIRWWGRGWGEGCSDVRPEPVGSGRTR